MNGFLEASKPFSAFGKKAESFLAARYPAMVDNNIGSISIGRNKDAGAGQRGGYRFTGESRNSGSYLEVPDKILPDRMIANIHEAGVETFTKRITDSAKNQIIEAKQTLLERGMSEKDAKQRVRDSISILGYFDKSTRKYVAEAAPGRVKDSLIPSLSMPYWDVSYTTKVFKQPFIEGIARNLVDVIGVPNIWADALVMYAESFEGFARISGVAKGNLEFNDSASVRSKMGMLVSEFVNLVVDYETSYHESLVAGQPGNFLTPMAISDRERYARLMLEQLASALWLFGAPEAGFEGLSQLVAEDAWGGTTLEALWTAQGATIGAQTVKTINKIIGDMQEDLNFLPSSVRMNVSPTAYKVLKWAMQSDIYNTNNPMKVLRDNFQDTEIVQSNGFIKGIDDFKLVCDPFCSAHTPWNDNASDLVFITFPTVKSALDPQEGVVVAPVAIENFILPSFPQRDGLQRTMLKRIGSLIAPITGTVKIIRGLGVA